MPKFNITADKAFELINSGVVLSDMYISGKLNLNKSGNRCIWSYELHGIKGWNRHYPYKNQLKYLYWLKEHGYDPFGLPDNKK